MTAVEVPDPSAPPAIRASDVGMWLFLASLVMFFGALCSGYVLLRMGSEGWHLSWTGTAATARPSTLPWQGIAWLVLTVVGVRRAHAGQGSDARTRNGVVAAAALGLIAAVSWAARAGALVAAGHGPSVSEANGCWFVLTGAVSGLVFAGAVATVWIAVRSEPGEARRNTLRLVERYWWAMLAFWLIVVFGLELR